MPIIIMSTKVENIDKIHGLTSGVDDYICKPFSSLELIARVKGQLRRSKKYNLYKNEKSIIEIGDLKLNVDTRQVFVNNVEVKLIPKEFDILELLCRNKGIVLSIRKIYEYVWKEEFINIIYKKSKGLNSLINKLFKYTYTECNLNSLIK